ncbi:Uncharacterised protein [Mycobacteroides abscessus subsp. abscessus]|nr:Uncharacterised protein [Mycobacteroides abscessus subsp. abscessus]
MPLDIDANRRSGRAQELVPGQGESDQQNVLNPSVICDRHLAQQLAGEIGVQRYRQLPGTGIGVHGGVHGRQRRRNLLHLLPGVGQGLHVGGACALIEQSRPPGKRRAARGQFHRLPSVVLRPGYVEVFQQDPPRHRVDSQVVDDQHQAILAALPQSTQHRTGRGVQSRPGLAQRLVGERFDREKARPSVHRSHLGYQQHPLAVVLLGT